MHVNQPLTGVASDFSLFQTAVMLEDRVRSRTQELEAALRQHETMTRALRESKARFRGVVSQSLIGIAIIEDGRFSYTNDKFDQIFSYEHDEISTIHPLDVTYASDRDLSPRRSGSAQPENRTPSPTRSRGYARMARRSPNSSAARTRDQIVPRRQRQISAPFAATDIETGGVTRTGWGVGLESGGLASCR